MQRIMFIGRGALGATFAAQVLDAGIEAELLCSRERKERYGESGFTVNRVFCLAIRALEESCGAS
jgi:3-hydroxyisobutyrate dehydrogenase-like beta-hydroxyacid dehydrogenase